MQKKTQGMVTKQEALKRLKRRMKIVKEDMERTNRKLTSDIDSFFNLKDLECYREKLKNKPAGILVFCNWDSEGHQINPSIKDGEVDP